VFLDHADRDAQLAGDLGVARAVDAMTDERLAGRGLERGERCKGARENFVALECLLRRRRIAGQLHVIERHGSGSRARMQAAGAVANQVARQCKHECARAAQIAGQSAAREAQEHLLREVLDVVGAEPVAREVALQRPPVAGVQRQERIGFRTHVYGSVAASRRIVKAPAARTD
jgi:hypothetical protein